MNGLTLPNWILSGSKGCATARYRFHWWDACSMWGCHLVGNEFSVISEAKVLAISGQLLCLTFIWEQVAWFDTQDGCFNFHQAPRDATYDRIIRIRLMAFIISGIAVIVTMVFQWFYFQKRWLVWRWRLTLFGPHVFFFFPSSNLKRWSKLNFGKLDNIHHPRSWKGPGLSDCQVALTEK